MASPHTCLVYILFQACLTNTFQKKPFKEEPFKEDFVAVFNKEVQAKEDALKPRGPSGPKPGQKSLIVLAVIAALVAVGFGGWKVYQVIFHIIYRFLVRQSRFVTVTS